MLKFSIPAGISPGSGGGAGILLEDLREMPTLRDKGIIYLLAFGEKKLKGLICGDKNSIGGGRCIFSPVDPGVCGCYESRNGILGDVSQWCVCNQRVGIYYRPEDGDRGTRMIIFWSCYMSCKIRCHDLAKYRFYFGVSI